MSVTGCEHPDADVVVLHASEYGGVEWCSLCGSVRDCLNDPSATGGDWRAPSGLLLPGWVCGSVKGGVRCGAFNGSAKEVLTECRACGTPRLTTDTTNGTDGGCAEPSE